MQSLKTRIDVLEVGGRGGVFQHALAVSVALHAQGHEVVFHTSTDCEITDPRVNYCYCFDWKRGRNLRPLRLIVHYLGRTLPHLARRATRTIWVQGTFKTPLTVVAILILRMLQKRVVFSPHNLFSRSGSSLDERLILFAGWLSSQTVVYNAVDAKRLFRLKRVPAVLPLAMYSPPISESRMRYWASVLPDRHNAICAIGQMREDKNIGLLIDACRQAKVSLVVMGPPAGGEDEARSHMTAEDAATVLWLEGYYPLEDIAAVMAIIGAVALPYAVASQSAVAELASAYGALVIAYDIGGLSEQADVLVGTLEVDDWAEAIRSRPLINLTQDLSGDLEPLDSAHSEELVKGLGRIFDA